jgi:hypothetical protein
VTSKQILKSKVASAKTRCGVAESVYSLPEVLAACNVQMGERERQGAEVPAASPSTSSSLAVRLLTAEVQAVHAAWKGLKGATEEGSSSQQRLHQWQGLARRLGFLADVAVCSSVLQESGVGKKLGAMAKPLVAGDGLEGPLTFQTAALRVMEAWKARLHRG